VRAQVLIGALDASFPDPALQAANKSPPNHGQRLFRILNVMHTARASRGTSCVNSSRPARVRASDTSSDPGLPLRLMTNDRIDKHVIRLSYGPGVSAR